MAEKSKKGCLVAAFVWIVILGALMVAAKFYVLPYFQGRLETDTGSESRYKHEIKVAVDSFSGYAILRSPAMKNALSAEGVKLTVLDDGADTEKRIQALRKRDLQMAVFTVDSFLTAGAVLGQFPASIVLVLDETKGADAIVAYESGVPSIQDLDDPGARIVLTPRSPSEFLARTVIAHFSLPGLPEQWWIGKDGAHEVFKEFKTARQEEKRAYALWEPYVSKALEIPGAHVLVDSSKLRGYIVDVLVAERTFLRDRPELARTVVEAYLRAAHSYAQKTDGMQNLVAEDAKRTGAESLDGAQAAQLVQGIEWKNTLENYAYFGLLPPSEAGAHQHLEEVIGNITEVLLKTGALNSDPTGGKANSLFYDQILKDLKASSFHPGKKVDIIPGMGLDAADVGRLRAPEALRPLTDAEWESLAPVGQMRVEPISFARGTARINLQSRRELEALARHLATWPKYYLVVVGHARAEGDPTANLRLAEERSVAARDCLVSKGVPKERLRVKVVPPSRREGAAQSVSFMLGQEPY